MELVVKFTVTLTSHLPGRIRAGSSFSMWLVVMKNIRPSCAATPSSAFSRPLKDTPSLLPYEDKLAVELGSDLLVKMASTSSSRIIEFSGESLR